MDDWQEEMGAPRPPETLEVTWWFFDTEPGMDDIYTQAGDSLGDMIKELGMYPFQDRQGNPKLFLARYEIPKYQGKFTHKDGIFLAADKTRILIDFLAGFPMECVEMLGMVGQYSTKKGDFTVKEGRGVVPPVPDKFFKGMPDDKILLNVLFLPTPKCKVMAKNLEGEPELTRLHWWVRVNWTDEGKFPVPGEFVGLAVRIVPDKVWGHQKSSPFIYSGNWLDTVYYTSAVITEVLAPDKDFPYPRYKVKWRGNVVTVSPSDFATYKKGDRVTILKKIDTTKTSQTWKDSDTNEFDSDYWVIAPFSFYEPR